ncbi:hypothetical protein K469DRAFT_699560 [Zopfia rhizophila CBS 207.26]|uniref:Uncharacterized protein n=1 Tax=Zopfia rhizophila CBS 207.26 TaxID=1314779 RepID=A0A6A6EHB2_9PEZI|nr:hypothetical protein K469DRAFT_701226 [Zopfia rhizophila CBS 207.26]KAF2189979.1 hypothetical protein K469DRAFT_699560 [Zopfia rhizophila CBS 207.26]
MSTGLTFRDSITVFQRVYEEQEDMQGFPMQMVFGQPLAVMKLETAAFCVRRSGNA